MRLWAISDLHLAMERNREGLLALAAYPEDWLIVAGDVCESIDLFTEALGWLARRFARVIRAAGNHELWLTDRDRDTPGSVAKYYALVAAARRLGVLTPEDPFTAWPPTGDVIVPLCTCTTTAFGLRASLWMMSWPGPPNCGTSLRMST